MNDIQNAGVGTNLPAYSEATAAFREIVLIIVGNGTRQGACGIDISQQFQPACASPLSSSRNVNAAFLIALAGPKHNRYQAAGQYLEEMERDPAWARLVSFYRNALETVPQEFAESRGKDASVLLKCLSDAVNNTSAGELRERLWQIFHPEAVGILENQDSETERLRKQRTVSVTSLNNTPINDVAREILFTSNALITVPSSHRAVSSLEISSELRNALDRIVQEEQIFWYDHPVTIGVEPENNEIIYGLRHLSEALHYEKQAGTTSKEAKLTCVLSVSVTHKGLHGIAKNYIQGELEKVAAFAGLKVHLFTEVDTGRLIHEILLPAAEKYMPDADFSAELLEEVIGVDGMYGRHYSFLKAVAAFWRVFVDPEKRATFKIDLDQVFPQQQLVEETGGTAFQHLRSPLWGAEGVDADGCQVELGMIAGALVNEKDIASSLFTPDVTYPAPPFDGELSLFCSRTPQALSTAAEMMTRYETDEINGTDHCIQRIHVTGGTNGILIDALRKHRAFTPTFVGRAEDQAFILSVLFSSNGGPVLRYLHKDGLFMRHDKEAFAGEAIEAAAVGKMVGDYERIVIFSNYARALPWGYEKIKTVIDPFTGSFVSLLPYTVAYLRLALKGAEFFDSESEVDHDKGRKLIDIGSKKLSAVIREVTEDGGLQARFKREKKAWNLYYDILDCVEKALKNNEPFAVALKEKARRLVKDTLIQTQ